MSDRVCSKSKALFSPTSFIISKDIVTIVINFFIDTTERIDKKLKDLTNLSYSK